MPETVLVTGAAQGLGAAIARHMAARGDRMLLIDRDAVGLAATASACPGALTATADLSDAEDTARAIASLPCEEVGTLIHNAAILRVEPIERVSLSTFRATLDVGIQAAFQLTQAVWPGMAARGGGALVFVSSRSGIEGFANETAYCAAKHALEGFSKCLAMEGEASGIVSYTITPGMLMHTPMSETTYDAEARAAWVDPIRLAPAFTWLSDRRPREFSGQRLSAWDLSQREAA
ncbi:SDR family NAD(P)-dependent oxidoreductase [Paracoccus suum]|uniref:SDR family NAD(P)-dependent oxidoreductase n=1 Tax=Paracoccus suum TaxID=2259340 RepID=A0A344PGB8_9RHOB|nr:SDR family oxidoreductase [Paracoccus suum]AXC48423.1 SDR family NAD(P)-dependent oxidoreductase [Paracoccus suum]